MLNEDEYVRYNPIIPLVNYEWWLKPSLDLEQNDFFHIVDIFGSIHSRHRLNPAGVRPALTLNLESADNEFWYNDKKLKTSIGSKIKYGRYSWTILDTVEKGFLVLCDSVLVDGCFDAHWDKSKLKRWLETEALELITKQGGAYK